MPMEDYPKLSEELLFLLPESKVDGTPIFQRHRRNELERCNSISDGGEGVSYDREEHESHVLKAMGQDGVQGQGRAQGQGRLHSHPPMGKRYSTQDISMSAFKRLRRLSRSLSIGHSSHCKWKVRGKSGFSGNASRPRGYSQGNVIDGDDSSLSYSSPALSPEDFERGMDKSRFAALLGEELADHGSIFSRSDISLLGLPGCGRLRSFSASCDHEHVPTIDKITQTSFADSPVEKHKRIGQVYHVDKLEVIEMEDNPSCSAGLSSPFSPISSPFTLTLNNQSVSRSPTKGENTNTRKCVAQIAPPSGASLEDEIAAFSANKEGNKSNLFRPDCFPQKLGSLSSSCLSPVPRSPCLRRVNAVHFSPYNEIRFLDSIDVSDSFLQEATDSPSSPAYYNFPLVHLAPRSPSSENQSASSTHDQASLNVQPSPSLVSPASSSIRELDSASPSVSNANFRAAQTAIENERRKRIRKLQQDLQRMQRELQDLDDLEYDVTEV